MNIIKIYLKQMLNNILNCLINFFKEFIYLIENTMILYCDIIINTFSIR